MSVSLAARSVAARSVNVLSGLRDLRDQAARNSDVETATLLNDAVVWIKDSAETISASEKAMRLASDLEEIKQHLLDAVNVHFPAFDPPRLLSPTVTIHCDESTLLPLVAELTYRNESQLGEVCGDARLRFELQTTSVPNGEAAYSVTLLESDDPPRLTAREAGLVAH